MVVVAVVVVVCGGGASFSSHVFSPGSDAGRASDYAEKRRKGKLKQNKQILTPPGDEMAVKRVRFF